MKKTKVAKIRSLRCPDCKGHGISNHTRCKKCKGYGRIKPRNIAVVDHY